MTDEVKTFDALLFRQVFRQALVIAGIVLLSRFTRNWAVVGVSVYGVWCALRQRPGPTLIVYLLLAFLPMTSPAIMPRYQHFTAIARLSTLALTCALILTGDNRDGHHQVPLGTLYPFLLMAALSSIEGYCPIISYLKIVNFFIFITGIYIGTKNIHRCPDAIRQIRYAFLALIVLLVYGSLATLPFPSIAYFTSMRGIVLEYGFAYADEFYEGGGVGQSLFTGITGHSQFLGPMLSCCFAWLLCDMLLVEKKYSLLHLALLFPIPIMAFMTRSRLAFLVLAFSIAFVTFYCVPNARVVSKVRARFSNIMLVVMVLVIGAAVAFEIRGGYVSKWLRKTNDVTSDARTLGEAVTGSRQGKIAACMDDFRQNLLFGKGFQVDRTTQRRFEAGQVSIFSASIEKGLLPLMVLGETGILGTIVFVVFLFIFFVTCHQRHYTATLTLFCVYLSTNLAEATFFSPSGGGGVQWIFMVVGGFVIDMNRETERLATGDASSGETDLFHPSREPFERHLEELGDIPLAQNVEGGEP